MTVKTGIILIAGKIRRNSQQNKTPRAHDIIFSKRHTAIINYGYFYDIYNNRFIKYEIV